jgi:hypothetical protein
MRRAWIIAVVFAAGLAGCTTSPPPAPVSTPEAIPTEASPTPEPTADTIPEGLSRDLATELCEAELRSINRDNWPEGVELTLVDREIDEGDMWRIVFTSASAPDGRSWCVVRGSDEFPRFWALGGYG